MTITKRKDGRWVATKTIDGKQKHVYGRTRKEVRQKLERIECEHDSTDPRSVESFLAEWLRRMKNTWREKTYTSYEGEVRNHIVPVIGARPLAGLTEHDIYELIDHLQQGGRASRSVYYSLSVLSRALNWGVKHRHIKENILQVIEMPFYEYRQIEPLTVEQARALLDSVKEHRLETLYRLALSLGMRQGELINLRWSDVDMQRGTLTIHKSKTRAGKRTLELPPALRESLQAHRERIEAEREMAGDTWQEQGLVFPSQVGTPLAARNIFRHFKSALAAAGLSESIRFHDLRHSCAAFLIAQGVNLHVIKSILGHSKIAVTSDFYGHLLPGVGGDALAGVDDLLR